MCTETETVTRKPSWCSRLRVRLSVRALIVLVLVIGGGLGWIAYRARVQRDAVAAIERAGGKVLYDWQYRHRLPLRKPRDNPWPRWLVDVVGIDALSSVALVVWSVPDRGGAREINLAGLAQLGRLDRLEVLRLGIEPLTDATLVHLKGLTRLKWLDISAHNATAASLACLGQMKDLEDLTFSFGQELTYPPQSMTEADLAHLAGLTKLRNLDLVPLSRLHLPASGIEALGNLRELTELNLPMTTIDDRGLEVIGRMGRLKSLGLGNSPGLTSLDALRPLGRLETLYLGGSRGLDDADYPALGGLKALETLHLGDSPLGDAGLAGLRPLANLRHLYLHGTRLTDEGLSSLASFPKLELLFLGDTSITDAGLSRLAGLEALAKLDLKEARVTPEGVAAARAARPGLTISH